MTRRVKKLMIDRKMTAEEKRLLPLLCDDSGILWMPGLPLRDGVEAKNGEGETIHLTFFEKTLFSNRPNLKYDTKESRNET